MSGKPGGALHVVHVSFFHDRERRSPRQLLEAWPTLVDVAEAACTGGNRISVLQACSHSERLLQNGVNYHFLPFGAAPSAPAHRGTFSRLLRDLDPDVLHVHGLSFPRHVAVLAELAPAVPIVLQDHADRPPPIWRRMAWRRQMALVSGVSFCAREQAEPYAKIGVLMRPTRIYEVPEGTSRFVPGDRDQAHAITQIEGEPAILWVGHLDANKDILTVLEAVSLASRQLPGLQLHCCYGAAPLLHKVRQRIAQDPWLRDRVKLLGPVDHTRIEQLMRAADLFVLGSHREGSGYALIEALACGLSPVVTDIASFRALTGDGAVGELWSPGDTRGCCNALLSAAARVSHESRAAVRAHFERELSMDSLGAKLDSMYTEARSRRSGALSERQDLTAAV
jgi:glycosyltransferase involved in cell wall biosynthesis